MSEKKEIRFIDPQNNELFRLPDGGSIVVTHPDGEQYIADCKFLDDTHFEANGTRYHICQFAEMQERNGSKVNPETASETVGGYRVIRRIPVNNKVFILAHKPTAVLPFATWQGYKDDPAKNWGHYWSERLIAETDLFHRVDAERTGKIYDHTKLMPTRYDRER